MKFIINTPSEMVPALIEALGQAAIPFDPQDDMVVTDEHHPMEYRMVPIAFGNEAQELSERINEFLEGQEASPTLPRDTAGLDLEQRHDLLAIAVNEMCWSKNAVLESDRMEHEAGWAGIVNDYPALFRKH